LIPSGVAFRLSSVLLGHLQELLPVHEQAHPVCVSLGVQRFLQAVRDTIHQPPKLNYE
jgi:hypothetical protein